MLLALCAGGAAVPAFAATSVPLPESSCFAPVAAPPALFRDGFDDPVVLPSTPSGGSSGGSATGTRIRTIFVPAVNGNRSYFLRLPPQYTPTRPWPLMVVLHGQSANPAVTAGVVVETWAPLADARGLVILSLAASGSSGGWAPSIDGPILDAFLADARGAFNIELTRQYVWGYSSGGHWAHGLGLANDSPFSAYGASAGVLVGYAGVNAPSLALRHVPAAIRIGLQDSVLLPHARADHQRFLAAGWVDEETLHYREFDGGHVYDIGDLTDIWDFVCRWAVVP